MRRDGSVMIGSRPAAVWCTRQVVSFVGVSRVLIGMTGCLTVGTGWPEMRT